MAVSDLQPRPLVIDTNIVLDLLVFQDEKMQPLLADIEQGVVRWLATKPMRDELERVLDYPTVQPRMHWHGLTSSQVLAQFDALSKTVAACHRATLISKDKLVLKCRKRLLNWGAAEVCNKYVAQPQLLQAEEGV